MWVSFLCVSVEGISRNRHKEQLSMCVNVLCGLKHKEIPVTMASAERL